MTYKIDSIEGIGSSYAVKLNSVGVRTTDDLLTHCASPNGRNMLSQQSGVSQALLLKWANMADLMRISGVGPQYAELLEAAGVDALAAVYHTDHRDLCAHERDWPFAIINIMEIVGASMGIVRTDHFKRLKMMQDVEAILEDCSETLERIGITPDEARPAIEKALLGDQPLALRGRPEPARA